MKSIVKLSFTLWATNVTPKAISAMTGIIPSIEMLKGERDSVKVLPRENLWSLDSSVQSDEVADHWAELEPKLKGAQHLLKEISETGQAKITVVIGGGARIPSIWIPPSMSEFAGFVNAAIDIDHLQP
ncbi:DUF4279 domain-containing protein [Massilia violaceinigra]|uniref:DUF4279 domain-containing protein n=1 Tax=Massilia violaceinigra TaxID=2045208 RepID=A0ABY4AA00_9BURK|nr:DUF4279 domain-containing protein [Massilia violaceinigra]UOD31546.1 DUF4279 domain-containing protein [Massilia violaceinigra]